MAIALPMVGPLKLIVENIYLRSFFGLFSILLGLAFVKIHLDRFKDSVWGEFYRLGQKSIGGSNGSPITEKIYLILGLIGISSGLIALFFGFRMAMVGV
jgi:hypothetical protein